jgi:putative SOS response-associated peptidase YedK
MCGRYATSKSSAELIDEFDIEERIGDDLEPDYNVAPTKDVYAVLARRPRSEPDGPVRRQLRVVRWGLVPSWAKDPSIGSRLINARTETVAEKPSFKRAFAARRCLLPADGYYEWYEPEARRAGDRPGGRKVPKQPFFIRARDGSPLAMAGLYELWRDDARDREDPDAWLWTSTVLTTTAEDELGRIHDRMPLLVQRESYDTWLDPTISDPDALLGLLVPAAPGLLEAYPVSTLVNKVDNNGPALVQPIPLEDLPPDAVADVAELADRAGERRPGAEAASEPPLFLFAGLTLTTGLT